MSIEVMTTVLNHSKATGRAKLVLLGIANHQGDQGAWPSIETLARYANSSQRSVMRDIQELEAIGELIVERNGAPVRSQYRPNLYWVNVSGVTDSTAGVTENESGVTAQVVRGDTVVTQNVINPKENLKEIYPQVDLGERFADYHFERFWELYPKKVEKIDARKAFHKALQEYDAKDVLDGAERLANDPNLPPKQFIPYPASWLRAGGWTNEPYPAREQTAEEKAERLAHQRRLESERAKQHTKALLAEQKETEKQSTPPPICPHGNKLISCLTCLAESKRNT